MCLQLLLVWDWVERPVLAWVGALKAIVRDIGLSWDLDLRGVSLSFGSLHMYQEIHWSLDWRTYLTAELSSWHRDVLIEHAIEFCKVEPAHWVHGLEPLSDFLLEIDAPTRQRLVLGKF